MFPTDRLIEYTLARNIRMDSEHTSFPKSIFQELRPLICEIANTELSAPDTYPTSERTQKSSVLLNQTVLLQLHRIGYLQYADG